MREGKMLNSAKLLHLVSIHLNSRYDANCLVSNSLTSQQVVERLSP